MFTSGPEGGGASALSASVCVCDQLCCDAPSNHQLDGSINGKCELTLAHFSRCGQTRPGGHFLSSHLLRNETSLCFTPGSGPGSGPSIRGQLQRSGGFIWVLTSKTEIKVKESGRCFC